MPSSRRLMPLVRAMRRAWAGEMGVPFSSRAPTRRVTPIPQGCGAALSPAGLPGVGLLGVGLLGVGLLALGLPVAGLPMAGMSVAGSVP